LRREEGDNQTKRANHRMSGVVVRKSTDSIGKEERCDARLGSKTCEIDKGIKIMHNRGGS
jgi:hypothetical protein